MAGNITGTPLTVSGTSNRHVWSTEIYNSTSTAIYMNSSTTDITTQGSDHIPRGFTHHLKDETVYVAIVVMGVIVPAIFIFVTVMICLKRRREQTTRRRQMLLSNQQGVAMDEIPYSMRAQLAAGNFA